MELRAILLAPRHVYHSREKSFLVLPDSPSPHQAISNMKIYDHPILGKILELHMELIRDGRKIVFGYVGIRANSAADSAAKDVLDGDISDELIAFSGLKTRINKYHLEFWQSEWDGYPHTHSKLHKVFPETGRQGSHHPRQTDRQEELM